MAKRKRLSPAIFQGLPPDLEHKAAPLPSGASAPPIAGVTGDAATHAALSDVVETLTRAKREGRMVLELSPDQIDPTYLVRDRTRVDENELGALVTSIAERGQQTPIEVVELESGYGLISGWRRLTALKRLGDRPVLALLRQPRDAPDAYLSMIEENELRVGLSYYERARIVQKSVTGGVFASEKEALQSLFRTSSRAKRSKIKSFLPIVNHLDGVLHFPEDIGERLGLSLSRMLEDRASFAARLAAALRDVPANAPEEQSLIQGIMEKTLKQDNTSTPKPAQARAPARHLVPGLKAQIHADGSLLISGPSLTPKLVQELQEWLRLRADKERNRG